MITGSQRERNRDRFSGNADERFSPNAGIHDGVSRMAATDEQEACRMVSGELS
jgi:hypothetical protein